MKKNKKKIIIIFLIVITLFACVFFLYHFLKNKNANVEGKAVEVLDTIKDYGYVLEDRDSEIYKENFMKLKELLKKSETIDYQQYAKYLATLFLIDLYNIDNKISKYDVGSLDFIYPKEKEKFQNKVMDTIYKLVVDNSTGTRKQELPIVTNIEIKEIESTEYQKKDTTLEGYEVRASIIYEKDLGYDKNVTLTLVKEENKMYVVNLTSVES